MLPAVGPTNFGFSDVLGLGGNDLRAAEAIEAATRAANATRVAAQRHASLVGRLATNTLAHEDVRFVSQLVHNVGALFHDELPVHSAHRVPLMGCLFEGMESKVVLHELPTLEKHKTTVVRSMSLLNNWRSATLYHETTKSTKRPKISEKDVEIRVTEEVLAENLRQKSGAMNPLLFYDNTGELYRLYEHCWPAIEQACQQEGVAVPHKRCRWTFFNRVLVMSKYKFYRTSIVQACPTCDEYERARKRLPDVRRLLAAARAQDVDEDITK